MQIQHTHNCCSIYNAVLIIATIFMVPFIAVAESHEKRSKKVVQQIGELRSDLAEAIGEQVKIIPFSKKVNARRTPIIYQGGLFIKENGKAGGLRKGERKAIKKSYRNGKTIVILDASVHDIEALHVLLGEGLVHDSDTDPVKAAYTLRKVNQIPTARVVTYARLAPLEIKFSDDDDYDDDYDDNYEYVDDSDYSRTFTLAVDMVVYDLFPPADTVTVDSQPCGGSEEPACWTDTSLQHTIMSVPSSAGVFNTTAKVYALHECDNGHDQYVVTAEADWTPTEAKLQVASTSDGSLSLDKYGNTRIKWKDINVADVGDQCSAGTEVLIRENTCRYTDYPLQYSMEILPPAKGTIDQIFATPSSSTGTTTSYSSGMTISIGGDVNISGEGPSAGIQAGVSWNNTTTESVPALLVEAGDKGVKHEGAYWNYVYCTEGSATDDPACISKIQMIGPCGESKMGKPQLGQTPEGKLSATGQSVHFDASPDTRVGDTFDISVQFTADMATTTTNLWFGPLINTGIFCAKSGFGPEGYCNCVGCGCKTSTDSNPVITKHTFKIPFPSTQCTQTGG